MPFIDEPVSVQNASNLGALEPAMNPAFFSEVVPAAFRTQNVIGSFVSSRGMPDAGIEDPGFNAIDYIKDDPKYSPYAETFAGITNKAYADAQKLQIDREIQDRRILDAAGGLGVVAEMAAGVFDLPTLLPFGGAISVGGRATSMAAGAALGAGLDAAVSETALQATQATRTGAETALNIGGSVVLGGALGALVGRYLRSSDMTALSRKIEGQDAEFKAVDDAFVAAGNGNAASAGAAARDVGPLALKDEALISKLPVISRQDPMIRLQVGNSDVGRSTVRGLAETPLEYADNAAGIATEKGGSVETRIKMWNAPLAEEIRVIDTEFAKYYHGAPSPTSWQTRLSPAQSEFARWRGDKRMTYKEFKEEVGRAAYMDGKHEIPEVSQAAQAYRRLDESLKKAAIDAKLFPDDLDVAGDISHRFRMYNKEKIIADRGTFKARLVDYFTSAQEKAAFRDQENKIASQITSIDRMRDKFDQSFQRLSGLEERLAARQAVRRGKMSSADEARQLRMDVMKERAPEPLVKALRGADENKALIATVKDSRKATSEASTGKRFIDKYPVLAAIKARGGVRKGSVLHQNLAAMDVKPKQFPGLFVDGKGIGDLDNFVAGENAAFHSLAQDGNGYIDRNSLFDAIRSELAGDPLKTLDEINAIETANNLDQIAKDWLEKVGLSENATVKDVREHIARVMGAEKDLAALDTKIEKMANELEDFDKATDALRNETEISKTEAATITEELNKLESALDEVGDIANASPRVSIMVDYARTKRDLFKAKLKERTLSSRVESLKRMETDGRLTDDLAAELTAREVDLGRVRDTITKSAAKADKLEKMAPTKADIGKTEEFANLLPEEVAALADETIDQILGHADGRIPYDIVSGPRGPLKERLLKIETAKIHDFVENDIEMVMRAQTRTMAADVELAKKFGSVDLAEEIRKVNDEINAKIDRATTQAERQALEKTRVNTIRDIEGIRDRLRGTYAMPSDPSSLVVRGGRVARNLNYIRLLGGMTLSAIPDMGKVVFEHGLTSTFRDGFLPMVKNFKAFRLAAGEVKAAGTALDMVLDSRVMALADITNEFGHHSAFERGLSAASSNFGVVSLMAPWNASMKQFAGLVTMTNILEASKRIAAGTASARDIRRMAASSIDEDLAIRIARQFAEHGETQDGVLLAKGANWTDQGALEAFRAAVVRDVDKIIVTPGQDKPLWMSTELGKTIGQFKTFGVSSMQKTLLSGIQQRDAATLNGVLLMMGLGALTYWAKQTNSGRPVSDNPKVWVAEAFDRSGIAGWLMDANNIAEKATRGRVGMSALTGEQISRYSSRNVYGAFLGPSADAVSDIFQISGSIFAGDTTKSDLRKARQLLPYQNMFYLRGLFNQIEESAGNAMNLPDKRK